MTTRRIESVQERSASARVCPERAIRLPFSGASVALIGGTLTAYASTEQMAMTLVGRIALLATAIAMLGLSGLEQRRESESGSSAAHWWALCSIIALLVIAVVNMGDRFSTAAPAMVQLAVLLVLVLVNGRASRWAMVTCIAVYLSMLLFVTFNLAAIALRQAEGGVFENPNALGAASVALTLIAGRMVSAIRSVFKYLWWPLFGGLIGLVVFSAARAALVALLVAALWTVLCRRIPESVSRKIFSLAVCIAVAFAAIFFLFSLELTETSADIELFGKSVLTGRDEIWPVVMLAILDAPLFGHGVGSMPGDLLPGRLEGLSAHNGFLQIGFQFGAVGVACFLSLILSLGLGRYAGGDRSSREYTRAVLIAAVVHEVFEVCLTQNHFGIGFAFWVAAVVSQGSTTSRRPTFRLSPPARQPPPSRSEPSATTLPNHAFAQSTPSQHATP